MSFAEILIDFRYWIRPRSDRDHDELIRLILRVDETYERLQEDLPHNIRRRLGVIVQQWHVIDRHYRKRDEIPQVLIIDLLCRLRSLAFRRR